MKFFLHAQFPLLFALCIALFSCQKDAIDFDIEAADASKVSHKHDLVSIDLGNGKKERGIYVDGDIFVPEAQLAALQNHNHEPQSKIRVVKRKNRINTCKGPFVSKKNKWHKGKKIVFIDMKHFRPSKYTGDSPSKRRTRAAMRIAVNAFNRIGTGIYLKIVNYYPYKYRHATVVVSEEFHKSRLAYATYPVNRKPGRKILINMKFNRNLYYRPKKGKRYRWHKDSAKRLARLLFHEIGHTLGFSHSDWRTQRSCKEGIQNTKLEHSYLFERLPLRGYLDGDSPESIMSSCISIHHFSHLHWRDIRAFREAYPRDWKKRGCR